MNRIFALIAVLVLFAGTAFAANLTDLQTAELAADTKGRSVVSSSSVILKLWYTGKASDNASAGVSDNTVLKLYDEAGVTSIDTIPGGSYDNIIEVVNYINSTVTDWHAATGNDAYDDMGSSYMYPMDTILAPYSSDVALEVCLDCTAADFVTVGIPATENTLNRIKSLTHSICGTGPVTVRIYADSNITGSTVVYRKDISEGSYNTNSASVSGQSPDTVNFAVVTAGRGISGERGQALVARIDRTTVNATNENAKSTEMSMSITYDQIVK